MFREEKVYLKFLLRKPYGNRHLEELGIHNRITRLKSPAASSDAAAFPELPAVK
jgi:hypothetical protein